MHRIILWAWLLTLFAFSKIFVIATPIYIDRSLELLQVVGMAGLLLHPVRFHIADELVDPGPGLPIALDDDCANVLLLAPVCFAVELYTAFGICKQQAKHLCALVPTHRLDHERNGFLHF